MNGFSRPHCSGATIGEQKSGQQVSREKRPQVSPADVASLAAYALALTNVTGSGPAICRETVALLVCARACHTAALTCQHVAYMLQVDPFGVHDVTLPSLISSFSGLSFSGFAEATQVPVIVAFSGAVWNASARAINSGFGW